VFDDAYIKRKNYLGMLSILQSYERDFAENAYSQMVLDGTIMLVDQRVAIDSMLPIGSKCLFCIYI